MVALNKSELDDVLGKVRGISSSPGGLSVRQITITGGEVESEIQDIRVYVEVDVSESQGWSTDEARLLRARIQDAVTATLHERHEESAFSVTTFLQPRDADEAPAG